MSPTVKRNGTSSGSERGTTAGGSPVSSKGEELLLRVRLKPRSSRQRIEGIEEGYLVIAVNAPAVGGRANKALIEILAEKTSQSKSSFRIIRGETSRLKTLRVTGLSRDELIGRLDIP